MEEDREAFRDLLDRIGQQRETLIAQADQVRQAINGVHLDLSHEVGTVSDLVAEQISAAALRTVSSAVRW